MGGSGGTCGVCTREFNKMNEYDLSVICLTRKFNFSWTSINHKPLYIIWTYLYTSILNILSIIVLEIDFNLAE